MTRTGRYLIDEHASRRHGNSRPHPVGNQYDTRALETLQRFANGGSSHAVSVYQVSLGG